MPIEKCFATDQTTFELLPNGEPPLQADAGGCKILRAYETYELMR